MDVVIVDTKAGYDQWAETYDTSGNPLVALEDHAFDQMMGSVRGRVAVDLGCGTGRNAFKLHALGAKVTGMDISDGMLAKAKAKAQASEIDFLQGDLSKPLSFKNQSFDLVTSSLVIEHIADLAPLFREMGRICKKNGFIFISDLHPAMRLKDAQAQFTDHKTQRDIRPRGYPHSISEYMLAVRDSGLGLIDVKEFEGTEALSQDFPKMKKYINWPMLVAFKLAPN